MPTSSNIKISFQSSKRTKFQFCSYQNLTENNISRVVSLSIRRLRELNLYMDFSNFGPTGPNIEISKQSLKIDKISMRLLLTFWHFQNSLIDFHMTFQYVAIDFFSTMCYSGHNMLFWVVQAKIEVGNWVWDCQTLLCAILVFQNAKLFVAFVQLLVLWLFSAENCFGTQ